MCNSQQCCHGPISLALTIWLSNVGSMLIFYLLTQLTKQSPMSVIKLSFLGYSCLYTFGPPVYQIHDCNKLCWGYTTLCSDCHTMSDVTKYPWDNYMCMSYSDMIYHVNEFICKCIYISVPFLSFHLLLCIFNTVRYMLLLFNSTAC